MTTTLHVVGDERFLPVDAETLAALGIDDGTPLDLEVIDGRLTVSPANERPSFDEVCKESLRENAELYRRLA